MIASATTPTTTPTTMLMVLAPMLSFELTDAAEPKSEAAEFVLPVVLCVLLVSLAPVVLAGVVARLVWLVGKVYVESPITSVPGNVNERKSVIVVDGK